MTLTCPDYAPRYLRGSAWVAYGRDPISTPLPPTVTPYEAREALTDSVLAGAQIRPDDSNVGLLDPAALTTVVNGDVTMSTADQVLRDTIVNGIVFSRNVRQRISNCLVTGGAPRTTGGARGLIDCEAAIVVGLVVEDTLCKPSTPSLYWAAAIVGHDYTAKRVDAQHTTDGFWSRNIFAGANYAVNVVLIMCRTNGLAKFWPDPFQTNGGPADGSAGNGTHNDGIQSFGGTGMEVLSSIIDPWFDPSVGNTGGIDTANGGALIYNSAGVPKRTGNAAIQINSNSNGTVTMNTGLFAIHRNFLGGGTCTVNGLDPKNASSPDFGAWHGNDFAPAQWAGYTGTTGTILRGNLTIYPGPVIDFPVSGVDQNWDSVRGIPATLRRSTT